MLDPSDRFWNRNLQQAVDVRKVLVLRIVASDAQTTATEAELANKIFGASGDVINLKSLYNQCSNGQLQFEPQTNNDLIGTDGVYTVNLPTTVVTDADDSTIKDAALAKASQDFGGVALNTIANHVIVCIPPGTAGGDWLGYAYVNHWLSVYNDKYCKAPSVQMHELGKCTKSKLSNDIS
jgi:Gametolysin peptidase M11